MAAQESLSNLFSPLSDQDVRGKALSHCQIILINGFATPKTVKEAAQFLVTLYSLDIFDSRDGIDQVRKHIGHWVEAINVLQFNSSNIDYHISQIYRKYVIEADEDILKSCNVSVQSMKRAFHHLCGYLLLDDTEADFLNGQLFDCQTVMERTSPNIKDLQNWKLASNDMAKAASLLRPVQVAILQQIGVTKPGHYISRLKLDVDLR